MFQGPAVVASNFPMSGSGVGGANFCGSIRGASLSAAPGVAANSGMRLVSLDQQIDIRTHVCVLDLYHIKYSLSCHVVFIIF